MTDRLMFKVWCPGKGDRVWHAKEYSGEFPEEAAEQWQEEWDNENLDYRRDPTCRNTVTVEEEGGSCIVEVTGSMRRVYHGTKVEPKEVTHEG